MNKSRRSRVEYISPMAELIRTRPEAFDFADAPDTAPLSEAYLRQMDAPRDRGSDEAEDQGRALKTYPLMAGEATRAKTPT